MPSRIKWREEDGGEFRNADGSASDNMPRPGSYSGDDVAGVAPGAGEGEGGMGPVQRDGGGSEASAGFSGGEASSTGSPRGDGHRLESGAGSAQGNSSVTGSGIADASSGDYEGVSLATWERRRTFLKSACRLSDSLLAKGVPRVRVESGVNTGRLVNMPRYVAFGLHRARLSNMFRKAFEATDMPTGLNLYPLCGERRCVEGSHLVLAYRRHVSEIEERRVQMFCTVSVPVENSSEGQDIHISDGHWWANADEFYDVYADVASSEAVTERTNMSSRRIQSAARRKLNRRKSKLIPVSEVEKAVASLFGKTFTARMWKELNTLISIGVQNVIDKAIIDYAARAVALKSGAIKDHDRKYFEAGRVNKGGARAGGKRGKV